jgi:hypothetical protein
LRRAIVALAPVSSLPRDRILPNHPFATFWRWAGASPREPWIRALVREN